MSICLNRALAWAVCIAGLCAGQAQAAGSAKRPTYPAPSSSAPVGAKGDSAAMTAAAAAALRDSDPALNGTVKEAPSAPAAVAKR
jgi:hypothetical protein